MIKIRLLLFLSMLSYFSRAYDLLGTWTLRQISEYPIIVEEVNLTFEDLVFRQTQVQQILTFTGCQSYKYLSEIIDNNIFINFNSFQTIQEQTSNSSCAQNITAMHHFIQNKLNQIFFFKIFGNFLVFLDAKQTIQFKFQRKLSFLPKNLKGEWNVTHLNSKRAGQILYFTENQIVLCQNKLKFTYNSTGKYEFKTKLAIDYGCDLQELQQTLAVINYFRKVNDSLQFYDSNLSLRMELNYNRQLALDFNSSVVRVKSNNLDPLALGNGLQGKWQPLSVFGISSQSTSIVISFTATQIIYSGGCNNYTFEYSSDDVKKLINIGQKTSTSNTCQNDNDGLYINAIWKITKYSFVGTNQTNLSLKDAIGKPLYELKKIY